MQITKIIGKLSNEERETILVYDNLTKTWTMDTTISKHANKAKKQGWTQEEEFVYEDGTILGGRFTAPARAITIRSIEKKKMSDKQMNNLIEDDCE